VGAKDSPQWIAVYETLSGSDADLVRATLETAGFTVEVLGTPSPGASPSIYSVTNPVTVAVPDDQAEDARDYLKKSTTFEPSDAAAPASAEPATSEEALTAAAQEVLELRQKHGVAACKYCGIATLDVSEADLDSRRVAILRAAGLGVNSATFSEFQAGERICSQCAGHEVTCDICSREFDAYLDGGEYREMNADEAYVCSECVGRLEDQLQTSTDW
jgi:DNA-directed RNA polymerase subunit RPC12/RpoP